MAGSYAALSALLRAGGRGAEALTYAQVALEAKQRAFGLQHTEVAGAMLHLADLLRDLGRYTSAASACSALHPGINILLHRYAQEGCSAPGSTYVCCAGHVDRTLRRCCGGRDAKGSRACRRGGYLSSTAACRYEEAAGPARNVATALLLEAAIALCRGKPAGAEVAARQALDIRRRVNGAGSKEAAAPMCTLSDALRELGR